LAWVGCTQGCMMGWMCIQMPNAVQRTRFAANAAKSTAFRHFGISHFAFNINRLRSLGWCRIHHYARDLTARGGAAGGAYTFSAVSGDLLSRYRQLNTLETRLARGPGMIAMRSVFAVMLGLGECRRSGIERFCIATT